MHRVPVLLKTARQFNAIIRRSDVIAIKSIKPGERITVKPTHAKLKREDKEFGKSLNSDDDDKKFPIFDTARANTDTNPLLFSHYYRAFRRTNSA